MPQGIHLVFFSLQAVVDSTIDGAEEVCPAEAVRQMVNPGALDRGEGSARLAIMSDYILASNWVLKKMLSW
jgi:hypothetical protein